MSKDFDNWNSLKKKIDSFYRNKYVKVGDIWWCSIGVNIGYESFGKGLKYSRPVLVLFRFNKEMCLVAPLTTSTNKHKYLIRIGSINGKKNYINISQIKVIDTKRLDNKIKRISKMNLIKTTKTITKMFGWSS